MKTKKQKSNIDQPVVKRSADENNEIVLKRLRRMKNPYDMRRKTYNELMELCDNDNTRLNRLIMEATAERVEGLVL